MWEPETKKKKEKNSQNNEYQQEEANNQTRAFLQYLELILPWLTQKK